MISHHWILEWPTNPYGMILLMGQMNGDGSTPELNGIRVVRISKVSFSWVMVTRCYQQAFNCKLFLPFFCHWHLLLKIQVTQPLSTAPSWYRPLWLHLPHPWRIKSRPVVWLQQCVEAQRWSLLIMACLRSLVDFLQPTPCFVISWKMKQSAHTVKTVRNTPVS